MINTNIRFNGFYESIHDDQIEWAIESYYTDDNGVFNYDEIANKINYKKIQDDYIRVFTDDFKTWLKDEYDLEIEFNNLVLHSPKEYNFYTDVINCDISEQDNKTLINRFKDDETFLEYLKDRTKSYDGFISFYTYQDALNNKNDILSDYILEYLVKKFEVDGFEIDNHDFIYQSLN